jgi:F-type H+-transporting ATPase subunit b
MATAPHAPAPGDAEHGTSTAAEHGSGGLPQFDFQWWPGQIAWTLIVFVVLLLFMRFFAVPRLGGTIEARDAKIDGDIAEAQRLKEEAEAQAKAAADDMAQARGQAQRLAAEAGAKAKAEIAGKLAAEEAKLAETTAAAEAEIAIAREAAMSHVRTIAADTASARVEKLSGRAPSAAEVEAALVGRA